MLKQKRFPMHWKGLLTVGAQNTQSADAREPEGATRTSHLNCTAHVDDGKSNCRCGGSIEPFKSNQIYILDII